MQAILPLDQAELLCQKAKATISSSPAVNCAAEVINSYVAIRDLLLGQAEEATTEANLRRAWVANEVVETCLRPVRVPYEAQCLAEADAARERQRCKEVKVRIAELRARVGAKHCAQHRAA